MSFTPIDPDNPENPENSDNESFQEQLKKYQEALKQEWEDNQPDPETKLTSEQVRTKARDMLVRAVPEAIARVVYLVEHAESENLQFKASTFIINAAIAKDGIVSDPFEAFMQTLNEAKESAS